MAVISTNKWFDEVLFGLMKSSLCSSSVYCLWCLMLLSRTCTFSRLEFLELWANARKLGLPLKTVMQSRFRDLKAHSALGLFTFSSADYFRVIPTDLHHLRPKVFLIWCLLSACCNSTFLSTRIQSTVLAFSWNSNREVMADQVFCCLYWSIHSAPWTQRRQTISNDGLNNGPCIVIATCVPLNFLTPPWKII